MSKLGLSWFYFLVFFILGIVTGTHGPSLPSYSKLVVKSIEDTSYVFFAISIGFLSGSIFSSRLYDKFKFGNIIISFSLMLLVVALFLTGIVRDYKLLLFLSFFIGIGKSSLTVGCNLLMTWLHEKSVTPFMNGLHFFFGFGAFLGPLLITMSLTLFGEIYPGYFTLILLSLPLLFLLKYDSPYVDIKQENKQTVEIKSIKKSSFILILIIFLSVGTEVCTGGWIYSYSQQIGFSDMMTKGYITSSFWGSMTLSRLIYIPFSNSFKPKIILFFSFLLCIFSSMLMLFYHSLIMIYIEAICLGIGLSMIFPLIVVLAKNTLPFTGQFMGYLSIGASLGAMTIPWIVGQYIIEDPKMFVYTILFSSIVMVLNLFLFIKNNSEKIFEPKI